MTMFKHKMEPDFHGVYQVANEILVCTTAIDRFPFKVKRLVKEQADIAFCTYKKASTKYHLDIRNFGSDSAVLMELDGAHIIFYNQDEAPYRVRFSILHELGHYVLKHELNLDQNETLYGIQEIEANCFAAQILMPEQLLLGCVERGKSITPSFIKLSFDVSTDAAKKRCETIRKKMIKGRVQTSETYDDIIRLKYRKALDEIAPVQKRYLYNFDDELALENERDKWRDPRLRWQ